MNFHLHGLYEEPGSHYKVETFLLWGWTPKDSWDGKELTPQSASLKTTTGLGAGDTFKNLS